MDKAYVDNNDVINRYLQNRLSPEEIDAFEVYFIDKPHIVEQLELNYGLLQSLPQLQWGTQHKSERKSGLFLWLWAASSSIACLFLIVLYLGNASKPGVEHVELFYLSAMRSADEQALLLPLNSATDSVILVVSVPDNEGTTYTVDIVDTGTSRIVFTNRYTVNDLNEIYLPVPRVKLASSRYEVRYKRADKRSSPMTATFVVE